MDYSKYYVVKYIKLFNSGLLKNMTIECKLSAPDLDHAARYIGELGCSSKEHIELFTNDTYHILTPIIYSPGQLNTKGDVIK